jgi:cytochrome c553
MNVRIVLGIALTASVAAAACGDAESLRRNTSSSSGSRGSSSGTLDKTTTPEPGTLPTGSKEGEAFFASDVHPLLKAKCATCHVAGGQGNPTWIDANDAKKTYDMLYLQAYVSATSRIVVKGMHAQGAAPALSTAEKQKWADWIAIEAKEPGKPAQTNVLEKFGDCFDKQLFDQIRFGELGVTRRQAGNNPNNEQEDDQTCTGCRDNTKCVTCHASDDATGFVMAIGNPNFPENYTFESSKKVTPAFIRQYVGTTPTGEVTFNPAIANKSHDTVEQAKAYQHPMFILDTERSYAIRSFVDAAIEKHRAGLCGK